MDSESGQTDAASIEPARVPIVGVSRRFGIGHMLVATGLFAFLFSVLQFLGASPGFYLPCVLFCAAIPLGQVLLYKGREPRRASCLVGMRLLPALYLGGGLYLIATDGVDGYPWSGLTAAEAAIGVLALLGATILMVPVGYVVGYAIGTISAGVFLVVDRKWNAGERIAGGSETGEVAVPRFDEHAAILPTGRWWLDWIAWSPAKWIWQNRRRPVRNAVAFGIAALVALLIAIPIFWGGPLQTAYLIAIPIAAPVVGMVIAGLFLAGWRMPLVLFAVAGIGCVYPLYQLTRMWAWKVLDPDVPFPLMVVCATGGLGVVFAGFYGWARRLRAANAVWSNRNRLQVAYVGVCVIFFVGSSVASSLLANSPRERLIRKIDDAGGGLQMESLFRVHGIYCDFREFDEGVLEHIGLFEELKELHLSHDTLTDAEVREIGRLGNLQRLTLANCEFPPAGIEELGSCSKLVCLELSDSNVTDADLRAVRSLSKLRSLLLIATDIEGPGLENLGGLTKLKTVSLAKTNARGEGLQYLADVSNIDLGDTPIQDRDLAYMSDFEHTKTLILTGTDVSDTGLVHLADIKTLQTLHLDRTNVTGAGLEHLKGLARLESLALEDSPVDDEGLSALPPLPSLTHLYLARTKITSAGLPAVKQLPKLLVLHLSGCDIDDVGLKVLYDFPVDVQLSGTAVTEQGRIDLQAAWMEPAYQDGELSSEKDSPDK